MKFFINKISLILLCLLFVGKLSYAQIAVNNLTTSICTAKAADGSAPGWTTLPAITVTESNTADFPKATGTIILTAPTGWVFNTTAAVTVTGNATGNINSKVSLTSLTSSAITFTWNAGGTAKSDILTISGVQVQANAMASSDGPIYCSTTTKVVVGLTAGTQVTGTPFAYLKQIKSADAGGYQTICVSTATMAANSPTTGTAQSWSYVSGPAGSTITSVNSPSTTITGLVNGVYTFKWSVTTTCGTSTANVIITNTNVPTAAAGADQSICYPNSTNLAANFPSFGTGTWSILSGPNTSTTQISSLSNESAVLTPSASGTYSLQWTISSPGCASSTDAVAITVNPGPSAPNAGPSQTICVGSTAVMAGNNITTGTGLWSVASGPSTLATQFSNTSSKTSNFTPAGGAGTYVLAWTATSSGCSVSSTMTLVVNAAPSTANAGADQTVCTTATLAANTPAVGTGSWTVVSGAGGGSFSSTTNPNATFSPANQNTAITIRWTISNAGCTSSSDDVVITATCIPTSTFTLPSGTTTQTTGLSACPATKVFVDDGGASGVYSANVSGTVTFTAPVGSCLSYSFSTFALESCCEDFSIFDGSTTGATALYTYSNNTSVSPTSGRSSGNSLTFQFISDGSVQYAGWVAYISCANACSGIPTAGTAVASPTLRCSSYTTNLSVSGGSSSDCSITYQWQSASAIGGPFTDITGATAQTTTASVSATTYYRCITKCGGVASNTIASSVATASIQGGGCGCPTSITLPYSTSGQTTCGQGDDITSTNVNTVNGSSSYYTGEDVVYTFTASSTGQITIDLTSSGSYTGLMLYQNCPTAAGTSTIANAQSYTGNKTLCATVTSGQVYYLIIDSYASPTCNPYDLTISAPTGTTVACNMAYTPATTTYSFESFTGTALPTTDDVLFDVGINFGFPICFDGVPYSSGYVASNGALVFDAVQCFPNISSSTIASGGVGTGYTITNPAPVNGTSIPRNAILAPWHDINPGLGTGLMQYITLGTAPNRRFIVSYENIPMYSCGTASPSIYYSAQIKVFETSNTIEIHVRKKAVCPGWNNGQAVLGLHNYNGTIYVPPVNATVHNATAASPYNQWTMSNTAYRYTTTCGTTGACAVVLPLGLVNFYGERVDKVNHLYWQTSSEENLMSYSVQRSTDGVNFVEIGIVTANNTPSKYHFEDKLSVPGVINYYRVIVHELNGTESSTNVISLLSGNDEVLTVSQLYPNPTSKSFMIGLDSKQKGQATINVYDVFGKIVVSSTHEVHGGINQYTINTEDLGLGVYYVEVLNSFNEIISKQKLIKE